MEINVQLLLTEMTLFKISLSITFLINVHINRLNPCNPSNIFLIGAIISNLGKTLMLVNSEPELCRQEDLK